MLRTTAVGVAITTIFGLALAGFHAARSKHASDPDLEPAIPLKRRIANTLKRWIDSWASRIALRVARSRRTIA
jgi:hypothetical protein